jgi:hypothetical protein
MHVFYFAIGSNITPINVGVIVLVIIIIIIITKINHSLFINVQDYQGGTKGKTSTNT